MRHYLTHFIALLAVAASALATEGSFTEIGVGTTTSPWGYDEYLPVGYAANPSAQYPLIVFCHGSGESGTGATGSAGLDKIDDTALPMYIANDTYNPAAIVLCPQTSNGTFPTATINNFINFAKYKYRVNTYRVYLLGLSSSADGVWKYASDYPGVVAAISPVATISSTFPVPTTLPAVWAAHNNGDHSPGGNPRTCTDNWMNAWAGSGSDVYATYPGTGAARSAYATGTTWTWSTGVSAGGTLNYTIYDSTAHGGWNELFGDSNWRTWLLNQHLSTEPTLQTIIVDNDAGSPAVTTTGTWSGNSTSTAGYYGAGYYSANPGTSPTATYTPTLPTTARYTVYMNFPESSARGYCMVDIYAGDGSGTPVSVQVDEKATCNFDINLGTYDMNAGAGAKVVLRPNNSAGYIAMDAFKFVQLPAYDEAIVDDLNPSVYVTPFVKTSGWGQNSAGTTGAYGTTYQSGAPSSTALCGYYPHLAHSGNYVVSMRYVSGSTRGVAPVKIYAGSGATLTDTISLNELTGGVNDSPSVAWRTLGTYAFNSGTSAHVDVCAATSGTAYVTADAIKFTEVAAIPPTDLIVEEDDATRVTAVGTWASSTYQEPGYGAPHAGSYLSGGPQTTAYVDYTPNLPNLGTGKLFNVYIWYPDRPSRGTVTWTVTTGGSTAATGTQNESTPLPGGTWLQLGTTPITFSTSSDKVRIAAPTSGGYVAADAVRFLEYTTGG
jgi:poly(3-hydroxybutyrate) depolymerase